MIKYIVCHVDFNISEVNGKIIKNAAKEIIKNLKVVKVKKILHFNKL